MVLRDREDRVNRDSRIDFLRGSVLLLIVADHVMYNETSWFALNDFFYFDAAACFIFMSGLVCGIVYSKMLLREGLLAVQRKALRRGLKLYLAQIAMLAIVSCLFLIFRRWEPLDAGVFGLRPMIERPREALPWALMLAYSPWLMDILKMYILLLALLPGALWLYHRKPMVAVGISLGLYSFAQRFHEISPRAYPNGTEWFWNPVAWQLLFFGAVIIGYEKAVGSRQLPRSRFLTAFALAVAATVVVLCRSKFLGWEWTDRQKLAPMHVLGFASVAYLLSGGLKSEWAVWRSAIAQPIIRCGRNSLPVFCTGVVISYLVSMLLASIHSWVLEAVIVACGVLLTLVAGGVIDRLSARTKPVAVPAAIAATPVRERRPIVLPTPALRHRRAAKVASAPTSSSGFGNQPTRLVPARRNPLSAAGVENALNRNGPL